jgi:hypothetical protein
MRPANFAYAKGSGNCLHPIPGNRSITVPFLVPGFCPRIPDYLLFSAGLLEDHPDADMFPERAWCKIFLNPVPAQGTQEFLFLVHGSRAFSLHCGSLPNLPPLQQSIALAPLPELSFPVHAEAEQILKGRPSLTPPRSRQVEGFCDVNESGDPLVHANLPYKVQPISSAAARRASAATKGPH